MRGYHARQPVFVRANNAGRCATGPGTATGNAPRPRHRHITGHAGANRPDKPRGITPEPRILPPNGPVISDLSETRFRADMLRQALAQEVVIDRAVTPLPQPGLLPAEMRPAQADPADNSYRANVRALAPDRQV